MVGIKKHSLEVAGKGFASNRWIGSSLEWQRHKVESLIACFFPPGFGCILLL